MSKLDELPRAEAEELLSEPLYCEDAGDWSTDKFKPDTQTIDCGLVNADGENTGLTVRVKYRLSPKTKIREFSFTVFKRELNYTPRVYSLDIKSSPKRLPDHDIPHEQWGDKRVNEKQDWADWTFLQVLQYFEAQTKITFRPTIVDPTSLHLKG